MRVFSEVYRRKRTTMGGIGALGRNARYSCSKMGTKSAATNMERSTSGRRSSGLGRPCSALMASKPSPIEETWIWRLNCYTDTEYLLGWMITLVLPVRPQKVGDHR